jgi:hypothetical protein
MARISANGFGETARLVYLCLPFVVRTSTNGFAETAAGYSEHTCCLISAPGDSAHPHSRAIRAHSRRLSLPGLSAFIFDNSYPAPPPELSSTGADDFPAIFYRGEYSSLHVVAVVAQRNVVRDEQRGGAGKTIPGFW